MRLELLPHPAHLRLRGVPPPHPQAIPNVTPLEPRNRARRSRGRTPGNFWFDGKKGLPDPSVPFVQLVQRRHNVIEAQYGRQIAEKDCWPDTQPFKNLEGFAT